MTGQIRRIRGLVVAVLLVLTLAMFLEWWSPSWWRRLAYPLDYETEITAAASHHDVDPYLIAAMVRVESSFDPDARSPRGAIGLMQIMPATARYVARRRARPYVVADLYKPVNNIDVGTYYLDYLRDKYGRMEYALAAYNGGEANVDEWLEQGLGDDGPEAFVDRIPFDETRAFVSNVLRTHAIYRTLYKGVLQEE